MLSSMGVSELRWAGKGISTIFGFARSTYRVTFAARYILTHTAKTIEKKRRRRPETGRRRSQIRLQGWPAHAHARLRLRTGQQGARHPRAAGLSPPREHLAHRALSYHV